MQKIPVCPDCGSGNIVFDAYVSYNPETNSHEIEQVFDNADCLDCGSHYFYPEWVENTENSS